MADGDRHTEPPKADGGAATLPGVGAGAAHGETMAASTAAKSETLPAGKAGVALSEPVAKPPDGKVVAHSDTLPAGKAVAHSETLPAGKAVAHSETAAAGKAGVANRAQVEAGGKAIAHSQTLPAGKAGALAQSETLDASDESRAGLAHSETLSAADAPHAATLPGPHTVADLPALPRVDDSLYSIGAEIARGGMGKILSARDRRLRRDVVIKVMRAGSIDPRFEREALVTARLQHPSIVRVYDAGVLGDGRAFYAMERVRGRSLDVVVAEAKTLRQRLALLPHAIAVCDAIAYAHSEGVLHRDLKPQNVLIGPFGETVVIDWGLAKEIRDPGESSERKRRASSGVPVAMPVVASAPVRATADDAELTQHGDVLGTPSYMAPEQARGERSDERSDIYALGALLYAMLSGQPPYVGRTTDQVLSAVIAGTHQPIRQREPELPRELAALIDHAMETEPEKRLASAKELADELRRYAAGKLLATHQYSLRQLLGRWFWKHRITVGIATTALIILAVGGVISLRTIIREKKQADDARGTAELARYETEGRRDRDTLQMAKQSLNGDPSLALAWLQRLSAQGFDRPEAQEIAAQAAHKGLAFELRGHTADIELLAMSPDHIHVASGSDDGTIRWWNINDRTSMVLAAHKGPLEMIDISPDGKFLASAGTDHEVYLWELASGTGRHLAGHMNTVRGVAFSPDSTKLASTSDDGRLFIWDVATATGKMIAHHPPGMRPVIWFDDRTVIVGGFDGSMGRYDVVTGKGAMKKAHDAELRCFALSPDHKYLVAGDEDGLVSLWSGEGVWLRTLGHHTDVTRRLIFTPDGRAVISAGGDKAVAIHPVPDGKELDLVGNYDGVKDIAISDDGQLIASAGLDGIVHVWTIGGKLLHEFHGHFFAVKAVVFTGDGRVVSGSEDDVARVWSLTEPPPPPTGFALKAWLGTHTNVQVTRPQNDAARR